MRYPWKDVNGQLIELGDVVGDSKRRIIGYIELDFRGVPCIHLTAKWFENSGWQEVDNKGPIEAYQYTLFDERKSKFYWWRKHYQLTNIEVLRKNG